VLLLIYRYKSVLQANDPSEADRPALILDVKAVRCRCTLYMCTQGLLMLTNPPSRFVVPNPLA